jgi:hypothetical protein
MAQCKGRYADKELSFTNGRVFYTEKRCLGKALEEDLCKTCQKREKIPFDPPNQITQYQGKVGEEYFKKSVLYGSPWFLKKIQELEVSPIDLEIAKLAQREASMETQMPPRKKKEEVVAPVPAPAVQEKPQEKPKKPRAPRKKKEEPVPPQPPVPAPTVPIAVESAEEPIEALEVVKIPVSLKTINGKQVWYDSKKSKVYELKKDKSVGRYLGRFDSAEDKIVEFPDSDVDV